MSLKAIFLTVLGILFLCLGAIGILLPVWPTTPFVLASVACLSSAPCIKNKIVMLPFFREHIQNYVNKTGLSFKTVLISMIWLWGMLLISIVIIQSFWISTILIFIGIAVTVHILYISRGKDRKKVKTK